MLQTLEMSINVFSKNAGEANGNYTALNNLLYAMKPRYLSIGGQYIPSSENTFGHLVIEFKGLPDIENGGPQGSVKINCTQLKYEINKDLGFISISTNPQRLIPVGFKITVGGRIITELRGGMTREDDTTTQTAADTQSITQIIEGVNGNPQEFERLLSTAVPSIYNLIGRKGYTDIAGEYPEIANMIVKFLADSINKTIYYYDTNSNEWKLDPTKAAADSEWSITINTIQTAAKNARLSQ
jgi:hypothetical protein